MSKLSSLKRKAREAEAREDWVEAIELYGRAVSEAREDGSATFEVGLYNRIGDLYLEMDDSSQAVYHYLLAAEEYAEEGLHPSAIALCEKVLRVAPDQLDAYRQLAQLHAETGLTADARRELSSYLDGVWESGQIAEALPGLIDLMERLSVPVPGYEEARELGGDGDTEAAFERAYEAWTSAPPPSRAGEEEAAEEEEAGAEVDEEEAGDEVEVAAAEAEVEEEEADEEELEEELEEEAAGPEEAGADEPEEPEEPGEPAVDPAVLRRAAAELASTPAGWKARALAADESGPSLLPAEAVEASDLPRVHPTRPVPWRRALERREESRDRAAAEERSRRRGAGAPPYARTIAEAFRAGLESSEVTIRPGRPRPAGPPGTRFATPGRSDYLPAGAEATGGPRTSGLSWLADAVGALIGPDEEEAEASATTAEDRAGEDAAAVEEPAAEDAAAVDEPEETAPEAAEELPEVAAETDEGAPVAAGEETSRPAEAEESEPVEEAEEAEDVEEASATSDRAGDAEEVAAELEGEAPTAEVDEPEPEEEPERPEPAAAADDEPEETAPEPAAEAVEADEEPETEERAPEIAITRAAFELAAEHAIELAELEGTGEDGRILKSDVEAALEAEAPADTGQREPAREPDEAPEAPPTEVEPADVSSAPEADDEPEETAPEPAADAEREPEPVAEAAGADVAEEEEEESGDGAPERPTIELPETEPGPAPDVESGDGGLDFTELLRHVGWLNRNREAEQTEDVEPAEPRSTTDGAPLAPWRAPDERPDEADEEASDLTGLLNDIGWLDDDEAEAREEGSNRTS